MAEEAIDVRLRLRDAGPFIRDVAASGGAVKTFGRDVETAGKKTEITRIETFLWRQTLYTLRRELFYGTIALTGLGAGALKVGYDFNEASDKATASFTGLLGSVRLARQEVAALVGLTHVTGFQLPQLSEAATRMLDFGFSVKETNTQLRAFGIYAQKRNLGVEGIASLTNVFARIRDQGRLTGRTLMQLRSLGVPAIQILTKELGLTNAQVALLQKGKLDIPAASALEALTKGIAATPGTLGIGGLAGIARSWVAQLTGLLERPLFGWLQRLVPRVNQALARAVTGFKTRGTSGLLLGLDPSGRALTVWRAVTDVLRGVAAVVGTLARMVAPLLPLFGLLGGLFVTLTGHATLLKVVLYALTARYLYLRGAMILTRAAIWAEAFAWKAVYALYRIQTAATYALAAAQWALNAAMDANPVVIIIAAVAALGAGLALLIWKVHAVRDAFVAGIGWVKKNWLDLVAVIAGGGIGFGLLELVRHWGAVKDAFIGGAEAIKNAFVGVGQAIVGALRGALDWLLTGWNRLHFHVPGFHVGPVHWGGFNLGLPHIPLLDAGGSILETGVAVVHRGEAVVPAARVQPLNTGSAGQPLHVHLHIDGREVLETVLAYPRELADSVFGREALGAARA